MARQIFNRDISPILASAEQWISKCLINDDSMFCPEHLWTAALADEVHHAFVGHPDFGPDGFVTKLNGQMKVASQPAQRLMAEILWALLLFPSNLKARTKRQQVRDMWALSGQQLAESDPLLSDAVLVGIGSAGPAFSILKPDELEFLIEVTRDLKRRSPDDRRRVLTNYDDFIGWINSVPQKGRRQFPHMLRFFAFPDRVERMSSNNDRHKVLDAFGVSISRETHNWTDRQLDDALLELRKKLQATHPSAVLDFYEPPLRGRWLPDRTIKTAVGEVTVTVPSDEDDDEPDDISSVAVETKSPDARKSIQVQAKLAQIGAIMGFKIWLPRSDKGRVSELVPENLRTAFLEDLPLNYNETTLDTIEQIDVLWLKRQSIARAFEVEHTTSVYSGLLRMADLLALQPNMNIHLHIVAPLERRDKVFREMKRPVFSLLERGPLRDTCTFISYDSVDAIVSLEHLAHTTESVIDEYEEKAET